MGWQLIFKQTELQLTSLTFSQLHVQNLRSSSCARSPKPEEGQLHPTGTSSHHHAQPRTRAYLGGETAASARLGLLLECDSG